MTNYSINDGIYAADFADCPEKLPRPRPWQEADSQGDQPAPAEVPTVAKQAGEAEPPRARWGWVETSVWTDRMLTAFEQVCERRRQTSISAS